MWAWALLPVFMALWGIGGLWTVFAIAVSNHSVDLKRQFPFISVCGTHPPQSSLFSLICNGSAFLAVCISVIRYQQVRDLGDKCRHANLTALMIGLISAVGVVLLANFQVTLWFRVHMFGSVLAFGLGLAYFWLQLWLTCRAEPSKDRHWMSPLRASLCTLATCSLIAMGLFHLRHFQSLAAMSEWALTMIYFLLFALFAAEFRFVDYFQLRVQRPQITIKGWQTL